MSSESLRVALVTPFSWPVPSAVNQHVADLARGLRALGHRPAVVTSSQEPRDLNRARALSRRPGEIGVELLSGWRAGKEPDSRLLPPVGSGPLAPENGIPVVPLGRSFSLPLNGSVATLGLPVDITSRLERLLAGACFDLVHVHEPVAPSLSFTAIRESRSPLVATFHLTPIGLLAYDKEQGLLARFFDRLDGRVVTHPRAAEMLGRLFPGEYRLVPPGAALTIPAEGERAPGASAVGGGAADDPGGRSLLYVYRGDDARGLKAFFRALGAAFPAGIDSVTVAVHRPSAELWPPRREPRRLRERVRWLDFADPGRLAPAYAAAAGTVLPYLGGEWLLQTAVDAAAAGCPVVGPDLPFIRHFLAEDAWAFRGVVRGVTVDVTRDDALAPAVASLIGVARPPAATGHGAATVVRDIVELYRDVLAATTGVTAVCDMGGSPRQRRVRPTALPRWSRVVAPDGWIHADLHIHSHHSKDCTSPVGSILATAREVGLGAIAIADHDTIAGGLEGSSLTREDLIVIVAEEVMTQHGEVIGLFLEEEIPAGKTFDETLSHIKEQGGLVYVPHPFDRLRTTPSYRSMVDNLHRIDVIETYNARNALSYFNLNAERFATKYNVVAGAGSDAHVLAGLGTAMLRMPRFDGPESFMEALREADIVTRRRSLLYLQSLKLLQNTLDHVLPGS